MVGADAGTGLANFDVQARDGDGPWTDWLTSTTALSATFGGFDGHTFYFRARGRDAVDNVGNYASGNGDTSTFVDSRRPGGDIRDQWRRDRYHQLDGCSGSQLR